MHLGVLGYTATRKKPWKIAETDHYHGSGAFLSPALCAFNLVCLWSTELTGPQLGGGRNETDAWQMSRLKRVGGIHFLFNGLLRTCLSAAGRGHGKTGVCWACCMWFGVDFEEKALQCVRLRSQLYIFLCVLRLDRKWKTRLLRGSVTKHTKSRIEMTLAAQIEESCQPGRRSFSGFDLRWSPAAFWNI